MKRASRKGATFLLVLLIIQVAAIINGWTWWPAGAWLHRYLRRRIQRLPVQPLPVGPVLFVAPHPDDEVLAAGGMLTELVSRGEQVYVLYITLGDGFPLDAMLLTHRFPVRPQDNLELGKRRQQEARAASSILGIPEAHPAFLGFPDQGLATLMSGGPATVFTSRHTQVDHNPYLGTWCPGASYTRTELNRQVREVLEWAAPAVMLIPHARDRHPDHRAVHKLMTSNLVRKGVQWEYIVHGSLEWPIPKGHHPHWPLLPPRALERDGGWKQVRLDRGVVQVKSRSILAYPSQIRLLSRFVRAFARANELVLPASK
jgi:LmbE family N-acetylglucosaminyl deacetylase